MKKLFILFALTFISCSKEEIIKKEPILSQDCYDIITWADSPSGDYITIRISAYEFKNIKVNDYKDYLGKKQYCK